MTSEDVYDVARQIWCYLCEAPHLPCESPDLRMECLRCFRLIEHNDEARFEGEIFHKSCARAMYRLRAKQREETEMAEYEGIGTVWEDPAGGSDSNLAVDILNGVVHIHLTVHNSVLTMALTPAKVRELRNTLARAERRLK